MSAVSRIVNGRYVHQGAIAANKGATHALQRFDLSLVPSLRSNALYFGVAIEECNNHALEGRIVLWFRDQQRWVLPFKSTMSGYGATVVNSVCTTADLVLPSFKVRRVNQTDEQQLWRMSEDAIPDGLQAGFMYHDDASQYWLYQLTMAPLYVAGEFDRASWEPDEFYGTATGATTLCGVILAVKQDP